MGFGTKQGGHDDLKWQCLALSGLMQLHNFSQKKSLIAHHIHLNLSRL